eukprot:2389679-Pyramimonas_sp.AAC.1
MDPLTIKASDYMASPPVDGRYGVRAGGDEEDSRLGSAVANSGYWFGAGLAFPQFKIESFGGGSHRL